MNVTRRELLPGVWLTSMKSDKFKTDCISVSLLTQLSRETVSADALLPRVLARGMRSHPTMESIAEVCDELYGARVFPVVRKKGEVLALGFFGGFISEQYANGDKLLESTAALIGEMLLNPLTRGGMLSRDFVESEKEKLLEDIAARINDKRSYALYRLRQEMCSCEDYACDDMGEAEWVRDVDYVSLTRRWHTLLQESPVEVFYCGSASDERVENALRDALDGLPRGEINCDIGTDVRMNTVGPKPRYAIDSMEVVQSVVAMGWRLGECMEEPNIPAIMLFNAAFGGGVNSKLFLHVREEKSLCYYISSGVDVRKGVMTVSAGIDVAALEAVANEIFMQLGAIQQCQFAPGEFEAVRENLIGQLRSLSDSVGAEEDYWLEQAIDGPDRTPEELAALCAEVTEKDVAAIASSVQLDMIYLLQPKEYGQEESDA
ncbi:MAG: insulinase family protein [Oscillospiraceae bacterium]|nr:insulinase family protein [Oscillospiraceae bacterium]